MNWLHRLRIVLRYSPVWQIILARLREAYRRPETIFWVYVFPLLMIFALGIAFRSRPVDRIAVDIQRGTYSDQIARTLAKVDHIDAHVFPADVWPRRLRTGRTDVVVVAPDSLPRQYRYHFDPTRPQSVVARDRVDEALQRAAGRVDPVTARDVEMNEPGGRYIDFLVPGLLGLSMMGGGMWGVGYATVDMRIRKVLKRLVATPMKKSHFLIGMLLSRVFFIVPEVIVILGFSRIAFGVVNHGRTASVIVLICLGAATFAGIGLLVGSRAQTLETVSGLMNLVMLPMWILSGIFFSAERFPAFAQPLIQLLPLTPLVNALRGVMLEGTPLASQATEMSILAVWGVLAFALALRWFRWT
jgi:ABC transporter DrrB family efflux protein